MPKVVTPLTDTLIKTLKPTDKKRCDGNGLFIIVTKDGGKWWRFDYTRPSGGRNSISFGNYPAVSLLRARKLKDEARQKLSHGTDPSDERQEAKQKQTQDTKKQTQTFEKLALEWMNQKDIRESTYTKIKRTFEIYFYHFIGNRNIHELHKQDYKELIFKMVDAGKKSYAYKAKSMLQNFLNYLDEKDIIEAPSLVMKSTLPKPKETNYAHITDLNRWRYSNYCWAVRMNQPCQMG